jgi:hypothetical protein
LRTFCYQAQSEAGLAQIARILSAVTRGVTRKKMWRTAADTKNDKTLAG